MIKIKQLGGNRVGYKGVYVYMAPGYNRGKPDDQL